MNFNLAAMVPLISRNVVRKVESKALFNEIGGKLGIPEVERYIRKAKKCFASVRMNKICVVCNNESQITISVNELRTSNCGHLLYVLLPSYHLYSCKLCVERYIKNKADFHCPACQKPVRMQDLSEESKESIEINKIRSIRREVFCMFDPSKLTTSKKYDKNTQSRCLERERFCMSKALFLTRSCCIICQPRISRGKRSIY